MKKIKYISEDESGGFKVAKVNLPLSDGRLKLFLEGKEDWLEEELLVSAKKIKEKDYRRRIFYGPRRRCTTKLCAPPSYYGGVPMQAWGSGVAMPPPNFAVPNVAFAEPYAHLPQPQQCGHHWRIRCKKHANFCSHPNQCKPNG
jgi:hypothetical protein